MKFDYEYRTRDNVRHEGVVVAPNRDAAFAALKSRGIRPSRLVEAPGFFNKLFGRGKRWILVAALTLVAVGLGVFSIALRRQLDHATEPFENMVRRQVIGDAVVIEKGIKTGWQDVFEFAGDQFLASFAIPGVQAGKRSTSVGEVRDALNRVILPESADGIEARQIKAMVEGIKRELRAFLSHGGTIEEYCECLVKRQDEELGYYNRAKTEIEIASKTEDAAAVQALWETRNAELRKMGIRLVAFPESN